MIVSILCFRPTPPTSGSISCTSCKCLSIYLIKSPIGKESFTSRGWRVAKHTAFGLGGKCHKMAEGMNRSLHSSPLEPLKNSLSVLKLIGWPLKIVNNEGTEVRGRKFYTLVIIWTIWMLAFAGIQFSLVHLSGFSTNETEVILRKEHIRSWDQKSLWILYAPNWVRPWAILYLYKDMDSKMTTLLRDFVRLGDNLPKGTFD